MSNDDRKKKRLLLNFYKEVFMVMGKWFVRSRVVDFSDLFVDILVFVGGVGILFFKLY